MTEKKEYASPSAFEQAINQKIRNIAKEENYQDLPRLRRHIAFERLLARLFVAQPNDWVLKGGYAMELRLRQARATTDVDMCFRETSAKTKKTAEGLLLMKLQEAAENDLGDFFSFLVPPPTKELIGPEFGGLRFHVTAKLNGKTFAVFHLDVAMGGFVMEPLEQLKPKNWLSFAGFSSPSFPSVSKEQQFAEKLHAYAKPRNAGYSSRVRDLVDLVLLIDLPDLDPHKVHQAIDGVFGSRSAEPFSPTLALPHKSWNRTFPSLAEEIGLQLTMSEAFQKLQDYLFKIFENKSSRP